MNAKVFISIPVAVMTAATLQAQRPEATDSLTRQLQEVVITAKQPATKLVGSTLVSTIAGSNLADLGNALDVLAQLPMIKVQDNTVSVIGKDNVEIYIDNRPVRDGQELQQLLSSSLKKVELQMAPGAAYESTTGAVLKISTKRNFVQGLSLTDQLQINRRCKWSATDHLGLNYRAGDWDLFLNGTINHDNSVVKGNTTNTLLYKGNKTVIGGRQHNSYPITAGTTKVGFNYAKNSRMLGAYYRYNPERGSFSNNGSEWLDNEIPLRRIIKKNIRSHSHHASAYYENKFSGKYLLHFDSDFKRSVADNSTSTMYPRNTADNVNSTDRRESTFGAAKLYLKFPFKQGEFTIGTQDSYTRTTLDYRMLNPLTETYIPSSQTDARQSVAALFASWSRTCGKFNLSAGARYEYVDYDFRVNGVRDERISRRDHLLTPDISLGYSFGNNAQMSLSYKMATVKPSYSRLTGSLNYVGRHEIEGGNPGLRDERMHDVRLFGIWNDFMLQSDWMYSTDTYAYVKQVYPANGLQLLMHPININVTSFSLYLTWSKAVRRWTPNITLGMRKQWLDIGRTTYDRPIFSYYLDNTFNLPRGWLITADISGQSKGDMHTNRFGATGFAMNASVGRSFLHKSLNIKLSATDIFNTANNDWTMNTYGIFVDKRQQYDRRGVHLNIIYRFHPLKSKYKGEAANEAEMNRF